MSIRWKLLVLTTLVVCSMVALFTVLSNRRSHADFHQELDSIAERARKRALVLVSTSVEEIATAAKIVGSFDVVRDRLRSGSLTAGSDGAVEGVWHGVKGAFGVLWMRVLSPDGRVLGSWVASGEEGKAAALSSGDSLGNGGWLACADGGCARWGVYDVQDSDERRLGTVVLGASMDAEIERIGAVLAADIVLAGVGEGGESVICGSSSGSVRAETLPAVLAVASRESLLREWAEVNVGGTHLLALGVPAEACLTQGGAWFLVLIDVGSRARQVTQSAFWNGVAGLAALLAVEGLMLLLLARPMRRLRRTVDCLPLVVDGRFEEVCQETKAVVRKVLPADELDLLNGAVGWVSQELRRLGAEVTAHQERLEQERDESEQERFFFNELVDSAPVFIVVQDLSGRIVMMNHYGERLLGIREDHVRTRGVFKDFLLASDAVEVVGERILEVASGERETFEHLSRVVCEDGEVRRVSWRHVRLGRGTDGANLVLSLGMDVGERERVEGRLAWLSRHDAVSGLRNEVGLIEELTRLLRISDRSNLALSVVVGRWDGWDLLVEREGHGVGDRLLVEAGHAIANGVRGTDLAARIAANEIAVVAVGAEGRGGTRLVDKVRGWLEEVGRPLGLEVWVGDFRVEGTGRSAQEVLDLARKRSRAGVGAGSLALSDTGASSCGCQGRVDALGPSGGLRLFAQPIVDLRSGRLGHVQVGLRVVDPGRGVRPLAEIVGGHCPDDACWLELDALMWGKTVEWLASAGAESGGRVFVPISEVLLRSRRAVDWLRDVLGQVDARVAPRLVLDLGEGSVSLHHRHAKQVLEMGRARGCGVCVSQFRFAFSSYAYLGQLPMDFVRVDAGFLYRACQDHERRVLLRTLCEVSEVFDKKLVADGVDSAEVLALMRSHGLGLGQGAWLGRAVAAEEIDWAASFPVGVRREDS